MGNKIGMVRDAQEKIIEAIGILNEAVGDNSNAKTYLIDQLEVLASDDHRFLCSDFSCDKLIEELEGEGDEE